ncbi:hypothetical protein [Janthinobacterium violaceinigrum]|uniref:Uncharacterized protein n=1 Tax=Janthinobacterium violaceinigrum TaxID=2654252 RepID=A0A6I1I168_9BURK|nr:hypothetical protein [Janthinobacterium violaceinigrum]KAB8061547.1 hypothetical protein GCN75_23735 [Janthinobacterium violaceinigrum]
MAGSGERRQMVHAYLTQGACQRLREKAAGEDRANGEWRFADDVKTIVSGEASFVVKMSFQTSLIGRNDYVAYPPQCLESAKNIFHFQKIKFALCQRKQCKHHSNVSQK